MTYAVFTVSVCFQSQQMTCSVPPCDKKRFMRVFDVCDGCVCVCAWVAVEGGRAACVLLLMSHDFPVFGALQNSP